MEKIDTAKTTAIKYGQQVKKKKKREKKIKKNH